MFCLIFSHDTASFILYANFHDFLWTKSILWKGRKTISRKKLIRMRIKCFKDFLFQIYFYIFFIWILNPGTFFPISIFIFFIFFLFVSITYFLRQFTLITTRIFFIFNSLSCCLINFLRRLIVLVLTFYQTMSILSSLNKTYETSIVSST